MTVAERVFLVIISKLFKQLKLKLIIYIFFVNIINLILFFFTSILLTLHFLTIMVKKCKVSKILVKKKRMRLIIFTKKIYIINFNFSCLKSLLMITKKTLSATVIFH